MHSDASYLLQSSEGRGACYFAASTWSFPSATRPDFLPSEAQVEEVGSRIDSRASLRILREPAEFEEIRDSWLAWNDGREADPDLFAIRLRHTREAVRPHVMVVYREGRPDCMLVGWLGEGEVAFKVGTIKLFRSVSRVLRFVNGGFLGNQSRANCQCLLREILRSLQTGEAEAVEFSQLRVDSPMYDVARRGPSVICRDAYTPIQNHQYKVMPSSFDAYFRGLAIKSRMNLKRCAKILVRDFPGQVCVENIRGERDVERLARKADEVAQKNYKHAMGIGFVNKPETREMLLTAAQKGMLRASLLSVGERPIAFAIGFLSNQTLHATFTGYDPEFRKYGPGLQTLLHMIEDAFEPKGGFLRLDVGCGDSAYKRCLCDSIWREAPVWIFAPSLNGLSLHVRKMISTSLHFLAMRLLENDHLRKLKNMCQRQAVRRLQCEAEI
jgi:hypothetical protein